MKYCRCIKTRTQTLVKTNFPACVEHDFKSRPTHNLSIPSTRGAMASSRLFHNLRGRPALGLLVVAVGKGQSILLDGRTRVVPVQHQAAGDDGADGVDGAVVAAATFDSFISRIGRAWCGTYRRTGGVPPAANAAISSVVSSCLCWNGSVGSSLRRWGQV